MKTLLIAAALAVPAVALAEAPAPRSEAGFHERLYQRYCEKLRESPEAYVQFVRRMQTVYGLTYADFAPEQPGAPVRADCHASPQQLAAVRRVLERPER